MVSAEIRRSENVHRTRGLQRPRVLSRQQRSSAVHTFEDQIKSPDYPCVGAKAAMQRNAYRFGFYEEMGEIEAAKQCTVDLQHFAATSDEIDRDFATFIAIFADPCGVGEQQFSEQLWRHLWLMARVDQKSYQWDAQYSSDPNSSEFAMSIGGRAFYIIGLHPGASRMARQFPHCTLVFNAHSQFKQLKSKGAYNTIRDKIRLRDEALQGYINPMVEDHGVRSEAQQYDGATHPEGWRPPFSIETTSKGKCPFTGLSGALEK